MEPDNNAPNTYSSKLTEVRPDIFYQVDIVVIGAGQAGLSAGPSASTIGANRAGRTAVSELIEFLQL